MSNNEDGYVLLLENMLRTYRRELLRARRNLIRARDAGYRWETLRMQIELQEILTAFGFYGFDVNSIMKAFEIDPTMLGLETSI